MENSNFKYEKLKLHFIYCGIIFFIVAISLFTVRNYSNSDMAAQLSFGATLVGIVLSVIAIFMSIMGENNMTSTKDKLVLVSDELKAITGNLNNSINTLQKVANISDEINNIKEQNNIIYKEVNSFQDIFQKNSATIDSNIDYIRLLNTAFHNDLRLSVMEVIYFSIKKYERNKEDFEAYNVFVEYSEKYSNIDGVCTSYALSGSAYVFLEYADKNQEFQNYIINEISNHKDIKDKVDKYFFV